MSSPLAGGPSPRGGERPGRSSSLSDHWGRRGREEGGGTEGEGEEEEGKSGKERERERKSESLRTEEEDLAGTSLPLLCSGEYSIPCMR